MDNSHSNKFLYSLLMMFLIFLVIMFDNLSAVIPNETLAFGLPLIIWSVGAYYGIKKMKKQNAGYSYYINNPLVNKDFLILFFVIAGGIAIAASNYLYAELKPLFVRELLTGYPLYTIRNIIYYPLEVLLMLELLIYSQRAGEFLTNKTIIPWGTFALFLLWGLPHLFSHDFADGIVSALRAFIYCIPFYASNRNIKTSYISMLILWFL